MVGNLLNWISKKPNPEKYELSPELRDKIQVSFDNYQANLEPLLERGLEDVYIYLQKGIENQMDLVDKAPSEELYEHFIEYMNDMAAYINKRLRELDEELKELEEE